MLSTVASTAISKVAFTRVKMGNQSKFETSLCLKKLSFLGGAYGDENN